MPLPSSSRTFTRPTADIAAMRADARLAGSGRRLMRVGVSGMIAWAALILLLALGVTMMLPRQAGAVPLLNGNAVTVSGLTITVSGCSATIGGVSGQNCAAVNAELVASGAWGGFLIDGFGGQALFSNVAAHTGVDELFFTLNVTANASALGVTGGSITLAGMSGASDTSLVSATATVTTSGYTTSPFTVNLATPSASGSSGSYIMQSLSIANDLKADTTNASGAMTLTSLNYVLNPAIEADSLAVLMPALLGLGMVRRRMIRFAPAV